VLDGTPVFAAIGGDAYPFAGFVVAGGAIDFFALRTGPLVDAITEREAVMELAVALKPTQLLFEVGDLVFRFDQGILRIISLTTDADD